MYNIIMKEFTNEDNVHYTGYGIASTDNSICINDITTDKQKLLLFIKKINLNQVSHIHIYDIIEDFLAS